MAFEAEELYEAPDTCEETIEYDNRIENPAEVVEIDPEPEEEPEVTGSRTKWEDFEHEFARYERSYRARRIRELMSAPIKKRSGRQKKSSRKTVPA